MARASRRKKVVSVPAAPVVARRRRFRRVRRVFRAARRQVRRVNKDVFSEVTRSVTSSFRRTPFVIAALVVVAIVLTNTPKSGPIHDFCKGRTDALCKYFTTNYVKFLGYVIFTVAIVDIPYAYRLASAAAALLWVYVIPEASPVEYVIQAALLHSFFRVRLEGSRFLLVVAGIVAYFSGFIVFQKQT